MRIRVSVVVNDLHLCRPVRGPDEADPPLIIDADAVLPLAVTAQGFETVARRDSQVHQHMRGMQQAQLAQRNHFDGAPTAYLLPLEKPRRVGALERLDGHGNKY